MRVGRRNAPSNNCNKRSRGDSTSWTRSGRTKTCPRSAAATTSRSCWPGWPIISRSILRPRRPWPLATGHRHRRPRPTPSEHTRRSRSRRGRIPRDRRGGPGRPGRLAGQGPGPRGAWPSRSIERRFRQSRGDSIRRSHALDPARPLAGPARRRRGRQGRVCPGRHAVPQISPDAITSVESPDERPATPEVGGDDQTEVPDRSGRINAGNGLPRPRLAVKMMIRTADFVDRTEEHPQ